MFSTYCGLMISPVQPAQLNPNYPQLSEVQSFLQVQYCSGGGEQPSSQDPKGGIHLTWQQYKHLCLAGCFKSLQSVQGEGQCMYSCTYSCRLWGPSPFHWQAMDPEISCRCRHLQRRHLKATDVSLTHKPHNLAEASSHLHHSSSAKDLPPVFQNNAILLTDLPLKVGALSSTVRWYNDFFLLQIIPQCCLPGICIRFRRSLWIGSFISLCS